jgi:acetate kinase
MRVLVVNAGSSSLKLRVVDDDGSVAGRRDLPMTGEPTPAQLRDALDGLPEVAASGHRIVHGGTRFTTGVRVDDAVLADLRDLTALAPLHQPPALAALDAVRRAHPRLPAVACFDTAFHAGLPEPAATYPVPEEWRVRLRVRRYGFHGLSHAYAARQAAELTGRPERGLRVVTCHLGAGASLAAVRDGRSVDTTMGFTPLEGLVMATRSGSIDPGLVLWLQQRAGLSADAVGAALEHESGLVGLAGDADMRAVAERAAEGDPLARLGYDVYLHRLRAGIAAMAAALDGLDVLVFTGGVGEHSAAVRRDAAAGLSFLGVGVDESRNAEAGGDTDVSAEGAAVTVLVVTAREDLVIAEETRRLLG